MNEISSIPACVSPYFKKDTYWLINPEYVSIVRQRLIRTEVSNRLGLHPRALLPLEHAEVGSAEQVLKHSLGTERERCVTYLNHCYLIAKMETPMYTWAFVNNIRVPLSHM